MDTKKLDKLKFLFSINENDMRSIFFLIILYNLSNYTYKILYTLPYMNLIKIDAGSYNEWSMYCMDLLTLNISITEFKNNIPNYTEIDEIIIKTFFKLEYGTIEITNDTTLWTQVTQITRLNNKLIEFTGICLTPNYIQSLNTQFIFNDNIIKQLLLLLINNIPPIKCLEIINPIKKCSINSETLYLNHLEECFKGRGIDKCKQFMNEPKFMSIITNEVNNMDICDATETLVKLGFKSNNTNAICFESYNSWEQNMIQILHIKNINPKLKKYIKLLLDKINPIVLLKTQLKVTGSNYSILSILNEYSSKYKLKLPINKYNDMEIKYNEAYYILTMYSLLMKIFNNQKHFNNQNREIYNNYYNKIKTNFLFYQMKILDALQQL